MADPYSFNTTGQTAYPTTKYDFYNKVNQLGGVASLMREYPQLYNPAYRWWNDARYSAPSEVQGVMEAWDMPYSGIDPINQLRAKITDLSEIAGMFPGPEATYIRWLIGNQQKKLQAQIDYERSQVGARAGAFLGQVENAEKRAAISSGPPSPTLAAKMEPSLTQRVAGEEAYREAVAPTKEWASNVSGVGGAVEQQAQTMPIPDWMKPYLEPAIQYEGAAEGTQAATVRPIGAQAKLSPTQLGQLAGYEAWGRAGAPTEYSEGALEAMADVDRWWTPLVNLSKALFPSQQRLKARWMPAQQGG